MIASAVIHILAAFLGLGLSVRFVPGAILLSDWGALVPISILLGLANTFIKPVLKAITLPLRIITLGLFSFAVNILLVWVAADIMFPKDMEVEGFIPLAVITAIIWLVDSFLSEIFKSYKKNQK